MANFTAKDVATLREKTSCGMMDCKKALVEADGDMQAAIDILREKGLAAATKKAGRVAAEGVATAYLNADGTVGALIEVNSETDFVAKNADFNNFVKTCADTIIETGVATVDELMTKKAVGSDMTVEELVRDKILTIGENIKIRRFERYEGIVSAYTHAGGRIGVMVKFDTDSSVANTDKFKEYAKDVAMQIAAINPLFLDEASVPADVLEHEKKILTEQVMNEGKPANIADRIVEGKIKKYYKENCLLNQIFVKNGDFTVAQYTDEIAKQLGGDIKIISYVRFEKGEGLEKKSENFADEVAGMVK